MLWYKPVYCCDQVYCYEFIVRESWLYCLVSSFYCLVSSFYCSVESSLLFVVSFYCFILLFHQYHFIVRLNSFYCFVSTSLLLCRHQFIDGSVPFRVEFWKERSQFIVPSLLLVQHQFIVVLDKFIVWVDEFIVMTVPVYCCDRVYCYEFIILKLQLLWWQ